MAQSRLAVGCPENYCAATIGTHDHTSRNGGADEYAVTVTLRVRSHDLEDVVARTFADPHCVDVRVQEWSIESAETG